MLRTSWTARKSNEKILTETLSRKQIMTTVRAKQFKFIRHVMRKGKMTTGKVKVSGRPSERILGGLARRHGKRTPEQLIQATVEGYDHQCQ